MYIVQPKTNCVEKFMKFSMLFTDKTIKLLFKNANNKAENETVARKGEPNKVDQFRDNICLMGNGQINYIMDVQKKAPMAVAVQRKCNLCSKQSNIQAVKCTNCNMEMCEFCGISCIQCNEPLCMSCVNVL